jgi:hypothetical protein
VESRQKTSTTATQDKDVSPQLPHHAPSPYPRMISVPDWRRRVAGEVSDLR